ncbi:hypothetical protein KIPB_015696 [Kipferlia bialata]|uniref:Uncharacterized protein n=1 Tax=Kipferlia bialata TaxID=797122 RepID=A0A391P4I5_9EUKA|nr:hypothetical protein KIPB_015696 [Kipferlia bialata]|eukprot:g15696.t1
MSQLQFLIPEDQKVRGVQFMSGCMTKQKGTNICGALACFSYYVNIMNRDPGSIVYKQATVREEVLESLISGTVSLTLNSHTRQSSIRPSRDSTIYAIPSGPPDTPMTDPVPGATGGSGHTADKATTHQTSSSPPADTQ